MMVPPTPPRAPRTITGTHPIPCTIMRGGTSKGVFFLAGVLPDDKDATEAILLNVFGSPDTRQISGLGGANSQTSKAAIVGPSERDDADVEYTFAQVSVDHPVVDWGGNCGNMSSAVGPFAINQGLVPVSGDVGFVRIHNTNTDKIIVAEVPLAGGQAAQDGTFRIPGVPGSAARIRLDFLEPSGSYNGALLPTSKPRQTLTLRDGTELTVSVVDAANPCVFLKASDLGLRGTELPPEVEANEAIMGALEEIRSVAASWLGIVKDPADATALSPGLPKVAFVAPPSTYLTSDGEEIAGDTYDLAGRFMSMQSAHRSFPVTGTVCSAAAAAVEGTVVNDVVRPAAQNESSERTIRIGHPYGVLETRIRTDGASAHPQVHGVTVDRTSRYIMDGYVYVPDNVFPPPPS